MKKFLMGLALSLSLIACGTTSLDKAASAQVTNTSVLQAIESATKANLITKKDAQNLLKQVDVAEEGIKLAPDLVGQAQVDKLAASRAILIAVQTYLVKQGAK